MNKAGRKVIVWDTLYTMILAWLQNSGTKWTIPFVFHEELIVKRITCLCWRNGEILRNGPAMYFSRLIEVWINTSFHCARALKVLRMPEQSILSGENVSHLKYKYIALLQCESHPLSVFFYRTTLYCICPIQNYIS